MSEKRIEPIEVPGEEKESFLKAETDRFFAMAQERLGARACLILVSTDNEGQSGRRSFLYRAGDLYGSYGLAKRFCQQTEAQWKKSDDEDGEDDG